jgi:hypothetical protein
MMTTITFHICNLFHLWHRRCTNNKKQLSTKQRANVFAFVRDNITTVAGSGATLAAATDARTSRPAVGAKLQEAGPGNRRKLPDWDKANAARRRR